MFTLYDRPDPLLLYAGAIDGEHIWLGLLPPTAVAMQPGFTSEQPFSYQTTGGQAVIDVVLRSIAAATGGAGVAGLTRKLGNGARQSLSLAKDPWFRRGVIAFVPEGRYCLVFRQTLAVSGAFLWSMDPAQSVIDPETGQQRVGEGSARLPLNEPANVHVARHGLYRAWHLRVLG